MRIIFAVNNQGLGHASRSVPLIKELLGLSRLLILSAGEALAYLEGQFASDDRASFFTCPKYPPLLRGWNRPLYPLRFAADVAACRAVLWREYALTAELVRTWLPDLIISDARYGVCHPDVPSYMINHHLRVLLPKFIRRGEGMLLRENVRRLASYERVLVPDHQGSVLSGRLSAVQDFFSPGHLVFAGHLSALDQSPPNLADTFKLLPKGAARIAERPDVLCVTGGYIQEQRRDFLQRMRESLLSLDRPAVMVSGDPAAGQARFLSPHLLEIPFAQGSLLEELFVRARTFVGRSGYSTVMDLAEHPKPAYLIPTPGQFEQVYLARRLKDSGYIHSTSQDRLDIAGWLESRPGNQWPELPRTKQNLPRHLAALGLT